MLFNSYDFILFFLPIALAGFWGLSGWGARSLVTGWLILVSVVFYALWSVDFLLILLASVGVNWLVGEAIARQRQDSGKPISLPVSLLTALGIGFNLCFLGYFKYINFFIEAVNHLGFSLSQIGGLVLPLGISFYTFEQISYLVGIANGKGKSYSLPRFLLFVTFFPHLIAGPILNANELITQFRSRNYRFDARNLAIGLTVFAVGLFKKTVIADSLVKYATPVFAAAEQGEAVSFLLAWQAAIAYTLQLYFDFSGYSDMAIGLSKMVNIKLPMNFFSPYQSLSISEFWRRWHISLGRFLRDYLYIPMGGSRVSAIRRYVNLLLTMLLGGLWHGANWTFILWGGLHGVYLCIDHAWSEFLKRRGLAFDAVYHQWLARLLTFLAVVVSWVLFRVETLAGARRILVGMVGGNGLVLPQSWVTQVGVLQQFGVQFGALPNYGELYGAGLILLFLGFALFLPNLYQFMIREPVALDVYHHLKGQKPAWYAWRPTFSYALGTAIVFLVGLLYCSKPSEFLYFQF